MNNDKKDIEMTDANANPALAGGQQPDVVGAGGAATESVVVWGADETRLPETPEMTAATEGGTTADAATATEPETNATEGSKEDDGKKKDSKKADGKSSGKGSGVLGNKTIEDVINREAKEEQLSSSTFSVSKALGGVMIARVFQKQIGLVFLVCAFLIIYISNRYVCQKKMVEISNIESKIQKARYKSIVCTSALTEKSRESNIMRLLGQYGDDSLRMSNEPPYLIEVTEEE